MNDATLQLVAARFGLLADPRRLAIIHGLRDEPAAVSDLAARLGEPPSEVSEGLAVLLAHGVLQRSNDDASYEVSDPWIFDLCELVCGRIEKELACR